MSKRVGIKDRIKEVRTILVSDLRANPKNWRTHPEGQRSALKTSLAEIGNATIPLAYETPEGLTLIDGHLRAELMPGEKIKVAVLDVTEQEADILLASIDPLAALAGTNAGKLDDLLKDNGSKLLEQLHGGEDERPHLSAIPIETPPQYVFYLLRVEINAAHKVESLIEKAGEIPEVKVFSCVSDQD